MRRRERELRACRDDSPQDEERSQFPTHFARLCHHPVTEGWDVGPAKKLSMLKTKAEVRNKRMGERWRKRSADDSPGDQEDPNASLACHCRSNTPAHSLHRIIPTIWATDLGCAALGS